MSEEVATLGGGCFWCLEAIFKETRGVNTVTSGYAGGDIPNPTYAQVCSGITNHAEVVQITFDPKLISYDALLKIFWLIHDPTTPNRQGNDVGTQYRSVIFYHTENQKDVAAASMVLISEKLSASIVTQSLPCPQFYRAEDYHQDYFRNNPNQGYCACVVSPKVKHFKKEHKNFLK